MSDKTKSFLETRRRFVWRSTAAILLFGGAYVVGRNIDAPDAGWALAALVAAPLLWWAYEYVSFVRSRDEFQSTLNIQSAAISAGGALFVGAIWGVAEKFLAAPHLNAALLLPVAALINSAAIEILSRRYQ